jgi:hypothetical protein
VGFADEVWWSRFAQPRLHTWTAGPPLRLVQQEHTKTDPEPKALACYGLLRADTQQIWLRFVTGRPVSSVTIEFLRWALAQLREEGQRALLLLWDNASWHISQQVRDWVKNYNRQARQTGEVRLIVCQLPTRSPWLNSIEPHWVHGKRAIAEPDRTLNQQEVKERVCQYYGCELLESLAQPQP